MNILLWLTFHSDFFSFLILIMHTPSYAEIVL